MEEERFKENNKVSDWVIPERSDCAKGFWFGYKVEANRDDLIPIKNHLPPELGARLKTKRQWEQLGFRIPNDSPAYDLHPSVMAKRTNTYFYEDDVIGKRSKRYEEYQAALVEDLRRSTGHGGLSNLKNRKTESFDDLFVK